VIRTRTAHSCLLWIICFLQKYFTAEELEWKKDENTHYKYCCLLKEKGTLYNEVSKLFGQLDGDKIKLEEIYVVYNPHLIRDFNNLRINLDRKHSRRQLFPILQINIWIMFQNLNGKSPFPFSISNPNKLVNFFVK